MRVLSKLILLTAMLVPTVLFAAESAEEKCNATGYWVAVSWYKAAVCVSYYGKQKSSYEEVKERISKIYPKLHVAIQSAPWAAEAKAVGEDSIYEDRTQDPIYSVRACEDTMGFLNQVASNADWQKIAYCWR